MFVVTAMRLSELLKNTMRNGRVLLFHQLIDGSERERDDSDPMKISVNVIKVMLTDVKGDNTWEDAGWAADRHDTAAVPISGVDHPKTEDGVVHQTYDGENDAEVL